MRAGNGCQEKQKPQHGEPSLHGILLLLDAIDARYGEPFSAYRLTYRLLWPAVPWQRLSPARPMTIMPCRSVRRLSGDAVHGRLSCVQACTNRSLRPHPKISIERIVGYQDGVAEIVSRPVRSGFFGATRRSRVSRGCHILAGDRGAYRELGRLPNNAARGHDRGADGHLGH